MAASYILKIRLFYTAFDDSCRTHVALLQELAGYDGSLDLLGRVNYLLDAWNALSDSHSSNAGEVKGLQRHLRPRLAN